MSPVLAPADTASKDLLKKAPASIAKLLAAYPEDADVAEAGCAILWLLSMLGEPRGGASGPGGVAWAPG